jgi:hypothetical protein
MCCQDSSSRTIFNAVATLEAMSSWMANTSSMVRNVVLDGKHVVHGAIVGVRPQVKAIVDADQLRRHPDPVALPPDAAFQHVGDIERGADFPQVFVLALEAERRGAARDLQVRDLRELVQQLLGEAVGEILVLRVRTHAHERQHRDGALAGRRFLDRRVGLDARLCGRLHRLDARLPLPDEVAERDDEDDDDDPVEPAARGARDGCRAVDVFLALYAFGRELEHPGEHHRGWQAEQQHHDQDVQHPVRRTEEREHHVGHLYQQPADRGVGHAHAEHVASS